MVLCELGRSMVSVCVVLMRELYQISGAVTESDRLSDGGGADPLHGSAATVGDAPDDALLTPCLGDTVGVVDVRRPVASMLIEG